MGISATVTVHIIEENIVGSIFYVNAENGSAEVYPYTSWKAAADTIQEAVDAAETTGIAGARVIVTNGLYDSGSKAPPLSCDNRVAILKLINLESVNGAEQTIIDGSGSMRCIYNIGNGLVSGFTITNGNTLTSGDAFSGRSGGGAFNGNYTNCVIVNCTANYVGGGIFGGTINNCEIIGNTTTLYDGGGTRQATVNNCKITKNSAGQYGGGISYGTNNNCKITENTAGSYGGGAYDGIINNGTIVSNITISTQAGVHAATLRNCIIKYNYRYNNGGATNIYNVHGGQINCCTSPEPGIDIDPDFVSGNDYRLKRSSACINAGNNSYAEGEFGLGGNLRILDGVVDIGCYELSILPFINITNEDAIVTYDTWVYTIGGTNNENVFGLMNWEKALTGDRDSFAAESPWEIADIDLKMGINTITVSGTNEFGDYTNDVITINRGGFGTGIPFIDVTNISLFVTFDVKEYTIAGSNNVNVIGGMVWTNNLGGNGNLLPGDFSDPDFGPITSIPLDVGNNVITVYGTNLYDYSTNSSVTIERGIPGTGVPTLDITNVDAYVTFDVLEYSISGENNTNVVGGLVWTNALTGEAGSLTHGNPWWCEIGPLALDVGDNVITVYGTNLFEESVTDSVTITRGIAGTGIPFIDVTNDNSFVTFDVLTAAIGGSNNANVIGMMNWTNSLGGNGTVSHGNPWWDISGISLSVGDNVIVVYGTNLNDVVTNSLVTITRGIAGTGLPFIDITNSDVFVTFDVEDYIIGGTNNDNVVGMMNWTNSLGGNGTIAAANSWENNPVALIPGINVIVVYGTNLNGFVTNSIINIERGEPGTGLPFINITNSDVTVDYDVKTYNIGGENNTNVVGMMNWTNLNTGVAGQLLHGNPWWIVSDILLGDGLNEIIVSGTNVYNQATNDVVRITRGNVFDVILKAPITETITNLIPIDLSVFFGAGIENAYLSINNGADWFEYSNPVTFQDCGEYYWTAKGTWNGGADTAFAAETNKLTIIDVPEVHLITPFDLSVFTNQLSINLTAEFKSLSILEAQLSTNNGSSWFGYDPFNPLTFPATGVWSWTARARNVAGWGYADATNSLKIVINPLTNMLFLVKPDAGAMLTNENVEFSVISLGGPYFDGADTFIFDDATTFPWIFPTNLLVSVGQHSWAGGKWIASPSQFVYAKTTNLFTVLAPDEGVVELQSPIDEAIYSVGWIQFFVKYLNVNTHQLSTNNGSSWFDYSSGTGLYFGEQQIIRWTARGKNTGDSWVYANSTNVLNIDTHNNNSEPTIWINNPNPQVSTTKWKNILFDGAFDVNGGLFKKLLLLTNDVIAEPVTMAGTSYSLNGGLNMSHKSINEIKAILTLANGNCATAMCVIICDTNYVAPGSVQPSINIEHPIVATTAFLNIVYDGIYSDQGGAVESFELFVNGVSTNQVIYANGMYQLSNGLELVHDTVYQLKSKITLVGGRWTNALWTIVCDTNYLDPSTAIPNITIENPNVLTTKHQNVSYEGIYKENGGVFDSLKLYKNGVPLPSVFSFAGMYLRLGGLDMEHDSVNCLESIIRLQNGNVATASWTIVCNTNYVDPSTALPSITIQNPNVLTTKWEKVALDGIYSGNGAGVHSLKLFNGLDELNPVSKVNGFYELVDGLKMAHNTINPLKAIIELANGNVATAMWTIVCNTNYLDLEIARPTITIDNPNVLTTKYLNVSYDGMYSENGGVFKSLKLFNNGGELFPVICPGGNYLLQGGLNFGHDSVNNLESIVELANGNAATATWTIVCNTNLADQTVYLPLVTIDNPNVLTSAFLEIAYNGTYNLDGGQLKSLEAFVNGTDRLLLFNNGTYHIPLKLVMEHHNSYELETILTLANGTVTNAKWTVFCDTNAVMQLANPFIKIDSPNVITTEYLNISYEGIYELDGGILQSIELFINGNQANPLSYAAGTYLLIGGLCMQHEGIYQLESVITLADGVSSNAIWTIVCDTNYVAYADIIENLEITLSNDCKTTIISWSNEVGKVDIWIQTNEFYNPEGPWIVMPGGPFDTPYFHTGATNYQACFYRVVQGGGTSRYDVGKMDSTILPGSIAWISFPFKPMEAMKTIDDWFGKQLKPMSNSGKYPIINRQITPGGSVFPLEYYIDDFGFHQLGATGWFPRLPESNRQLSEMLAYILFLPDSHPAVYLTAVGMAPTNSVSIEMPRETAVPWIGLPYPTDVSMTKTVLTNLFYPPKSNLGSYDTLLYQNELGGSAASIEYYIDDFGFFELGATNFFPEHQIINPVKGYLIFYSDDDRVGNKEWICPKPY